MPFFLFSLTLAIDNTLSFGCFQAISAIFVRFFQRLKNENVPKYTKNHGFFTKSVVFVARLEGFDLPCGAGHLAALERPRRSIHSRSGSNPTRGISKQNGHPCRDDRLFWHALRDSTCPAGQATSRLWSAPGALPSALGFESPLDIKNPATPDGVTGFLARHSGKYTNRRFLH